MNASNDLVQFIRRKEQPYLPLEDHMTYVEHLAEGIRQAATLRQGNKFIIRELKRLFTHSFLCKSVELTKYLIETYAKHYIPLEELCKCKNTLHASYFPDFVRLIQKAYGINRFEEFKKKCFHHRGYIMQKYNSKMMHTLFGAAKLTLRSEIDGQKFKKITLSYQYYKNEIVTNSVCINKAYDFPFFRAKKNMFPNILLKLLHEGFETSIYCEPYVEDIFSNSKKLLSPKLIWDMYFYCDRYYLDYLDYEIKMQSDCQKLMLIYCFEKKKSHHNVFV